MQMSIDIIRRVGESPLNRHIFREIQMVINIQLVYQNPVIETRLIPTNIDQWVRNKMITDSDNMVSPPVAVRVINN